MCLGTKLDLLEYNGWSRHLVCHRSSLQLHAAGKVWCYRLATMDAPNAWTRNILKIALNIHDCSDALLSRSWLHTLEIYFFFGFRPCQHTRHQTGGAHKAHPQSGLPSTAVGSKCKSFWGDFWPQRLRHSLKSELCAGHCPASLDQASIMGTNLGVVKAQEQEQGQDIKAAQPVWRGSARRGRHPI